MAVPGKQRPRVQKRSGRAAKECQDADVAMPEVWPLMTECRVERRNPETSAAKGAGGVKKPGTSVPLPGAGWNLASSR